MKTDKLQLWILFVMTLISWKAIDNNWIIEQHKGYTLIYTAIDKKEILEYEKIIEKGMTSVNA